MRCNFSQLLKVTFIGLLVCSPGLLAFAMVWQQHLKLVAKNNLLCSNTNVFDQILSCSKYAQVINNFGLIFGLFIISLGLLVFSLDRYLAYRMNERQKIIDKLERIYHSKY